ncbi:hypothetical protein CERZMDRAFT_35074 [Cercospora zeae-maydis SCOH1-5]|uniref:NAD-dependent epimerase/dehydratase domain-containing protein n=1 Tax=Cercospora zeae-maydis SCOH1-5 TaxID=717836 RepID=A0A6A6FQA4_9PEZI|nr:hypothetical protein CERZMDRAFT_35074 [Cercospora zeae-maydis SCOH1-5]
MKVFVTGASGFIGRAVVFDLVKHGHEVVGLARSGASAEKVKQAGGTVLEGNLEDPESLRQGARTCDGIIHLAFVHDFSSTEAVQHATAVDRAAISAMGEEIAGTGKALIIASGTLGFPQGQVATEDSEPERGGPLSDRMKSADLLFQLTKEKDIRGIVLRFSPTVHGEGDLGLIHMLGDAAKRDGFATYIDQGSSRWSAVHRYDAATLTRLALEKGKAGAAYNAAAEEGVSMKDIMTAIGAKLSLPVKSRTTEEALPSLGLFAYLINMDNPTSSEKTRNELGWKPEHPGLLGDIKENYF